MMVTLHLKHATLPALGQCAPVCMVTQKLVSVDDVGKCWVVVQWKIDQGGCQPCTAASCHFEPDSVMKPYQLLSTIEA